MTSFGRNGPSGVISSMGARVESPPWLWERNFASVQIGLLLENLCASCFGDHIISLRNQVPGRYKIVLKKCFLLSKREKTLSNLNFTGVNVHIETRLHAFFLLPPRL